MMDFPLLGKSIHSQTAEEYREFIRGKYEAPAEKKQVKQFTFRLTDKGTPVFTVRRKPRWISASELDELAKMHGVPKSKMYMWASQKKGLEIYTDEKAARMISVD